MNTLKTILVLLVLFVISSTAMAEDAATDSLWVKAHELGEGVVFEEEDSLYVITSGQSLDLQLACDKGAFNGRVAFATHIKTATEDQSNSVTLNGSTVLRRQLTKDGKFWNAKVLMKMPNPIK